MNALTTPPTSSSPEALLAALLSSFGKAPKGAKPAARNAKSIPRNARPISQVEAFNELKTGYRIWKAEAKVIHLEEQTCECCGSRGTSVKDELFLLSHKASHSAWLRHEGFGIEAQEDLPVRFHRLEPRTVSFCAVCASTAIDDVLITLSSPQLSFPF